MKSWVADGGDSQVEPCSGNVSDCISTMILSISDMLTSVAAHRSRPCLW
jgi:hypothetical protein